jgi:hypothetical protein
MNITLNLGKVNCLGKGTTAPAAIPLVKTVHVFYFMVTSQAKQAHDP